MIEVNSDRTSEIYLAPGEFYFGAAPCLIRTLLGSCVAVSLWHPLRHIGGMCHYLLPELGQKDIESDAGRYAQGALRLFEKAIQHHRSCLGEYEAKIFGGAEMFGDRSVGIGLRNVQVAHTWLANKRIPLIAEHSGGNGHRSLVLDLETGDVWLKYVEN